MPANAAPAKLAELATWGENSIGWVAEFDTMLGLDTWLKRNDRALGHLEIKHPQIGQRLRIAIAAATETLSRDQEKW